MKKNELAQAIDLSHRQEELYPLLERQVKLYTMGVNLATCRNCAGTASLYPLLHRDPFDA